MLKRRLLLLLLASASVLCAQRTPSSGNSTAQEAKQSFVISISSPRKTWRSTDSIRLDVTVKNLTDRRITLISLWSAWETGEIIIRDEGGNVIPTILNGARSSRSVFSVEPGKDNRESLPIDKQFDLTRPGRYSLQVEKEDRATKTVVKSNTLVLTITP